MQLGINPNVFNGHDQLMHMTREGPLDDSQNGEDRKRGKGGGSQEDIEDILDIFKIYLHQ